MTPDILIMLTIMAGSFVLFALEKIRVDLVALAALGVLTVLGIFREDFLTAKEAVSGFSNSATVTVGCMLVMSHALLKTGAVHGISRMLLLLSGFGEKRMFVLLMLSVGFVSAWINNTATVAIFIPVTMLICRQHKISPSRFLMPVSFMSMFGGVCTLIGTSTNILGSNLLVEHHYRPVSFFEMTKLGVIFFAVGLVFLLFVGRKQLHDRVPTRSLTKKFGLGDYLAGVVVQPNSVLVGKTVRDLHMGENYEIMVLEIIRGEEKIYTGIRDAPFHAGDVLMIRGPVNQIIEFNKSHGLKMGPKSSFGDLDLTSKDLSLVEAIISPGSNLVGRTVAEADLRHKFGVFALAIRKQGQTILDRINRIPLEAGDSLLLQGRRGPMEKLAESGDFMLTQELEIPVMRRNKAIYVLVIMLSIVILAALDLVSIMVLSLVGCVLVVLLGCLTIQEAYEGLDWMVIFMLAAMIPMGTAIDKTGTGEYLAGLVVQVTGGFGPYALIALFLLVSMISTELLSNNATAILFMPVGLAAAVKIGIDPRPVAMAILYGSSFSLCTPFGYQTNLMVYGPGGYRFRDYMSVGLPLSLILYVLGSILIPIFWPLYP